MEESGSAKSPLFEQIIGIVQEAGVELPISTEDDSVIPPVASIDELELVGRAAILLRAAL